MLHLTPRQVALYRRGALRDSDALHHLTACPRCRLRVGATAEMPPQGAPIRPSAPRADRAGGHPSPVMLAAYLDRLLPPRERATITRHIRRCPRCSAERAFLRRAVPAARLTDGPPPDLLERTAAQLRARRLTSAAALPERAQEGDEVDVP